MPAVPNFPGVPALDSYIGDVVGQLVEDVLDAIFGTTVQWGIYLDGLPVLSYDNQVSFSYSQDWKISTYPVEEGSFQTYNKVQMPAEVRCKFSAGGSVTNRQNLLQSIDEVMSTTDLYDIVTPETVYLGYNFMHREYDREANNVGLLVVDITLEEVIETATAQFQDTASPNATGQVGLGNVSAPTSSQSEQSTVSQGGWN